MSDLRKKHYAEELSAVTSLGHLRLTTALLYKDEADHDAVYVDEFVDGGKTMIAISYIARKDRKTSAGRLCSPEDASDYIDLYVLRLLLEKHGRL